MAMNKDLKIHQSKLSFRFADPLAVAEGPTLNANSNRNREPVFADEKADAVEFIGFTFLIIVGIKKQKSRFAIQQSFSLPGTLDPMARRLSFR